MTARHYSNSQNSIISFDYSWFLAKNLSSFVSLPWKLHNRYCHSENATKQIERISFSPFNNNYCLNINRNHLNKGIVPKTLKIVRWLNSGAEKIWFSSSKIAIQNQTGIIEFEVIVITVWPWAIWIKVKKPRQWTPQH